MRFRYETHLHTSEGSACGRSSAADMIESYARAGFSGVVVTDHFLNGNTTVPRGLPWAERIHLFCEGYEHARESGERFGVRVFFGWEATFYGTDFLTYGLTKRFLLDNDDILEWTVNEYLETVRRAGGFVIHAHPFREAMYIPSVRLFPADVDAVEVFNGGHAIAEFNDRADEYAALHQLPRTSGSDAHHTDATGRGGMGFESEICSIEDLIEGIRAGSGSLIACTN